MDNGNDPGEYIPPRRIEEGDPVLFYDNGNFEQVERGRVLSVEYATGNQLASILIYSDERTESEVPFAYGEFQPVRGYFYEEQPSEGGELGG